MKRAKVVTLTAVSMLAAACTESGENVEDGAAAGRPMAIGADAEQPGRDGAGVEAGAGTPAAAEAASPAQNEGTDAAEVDATALVPPPSGDTLAAAKVQLPKGWQGTGVLARRGGRIPKRAPAWARIALEVVERGGQRYLVATGRASKIKDHHLARVTAEDRARAELSRWTGSPKLEGSTVRQIWRDPRNGETFAQVDLLLPEGWVPGRPF